MKPRYALAPLAVLVVLLVSCTAAPTYRGEQSSHFNGNVFVNTIPMQKGAGDMLALGWGTLSEAETWPDWIEVEQQTIANERVYEGISVTFINHASFLVQVAGVNILTDPVYARRASPFQWAGPERVHAPGVKLEDLPPIDVIIISHNHYDHLDEFTLRHFAQMDKQPLVLSGLGNGQLFDQLGLDNYRDLDWENSVSAHGLDFVFTECRHRSGRGIYDQMKTLWGAFVVKTPAGNIYFGGDSGYSPHFKATGDSHGPFALSLLPIGAYEPRWFMADVHVNPAEAVQAHVDLGSEYSIGMHFGTFQLTYEAIDQPRIDLASALQEQRIHPSRFRVLTPGETSIIRKQDFAASQNPLIDRNIDAINYN
jgi:L-ascorbate metabolism protein UlaG (beta-lactamase superfamily)